MKNYITLLLVIYLTIIPTLILGMNAPSQESDGEESVSSGTGDTISEQLEGKHYFFNMPTELQYKVIELLIQEIIDTSNDIFEAHTKLAQSEMLKKVILINKDFRLLLPTLKNRFLYLLSKKFFNPFLDQKPKKINKELKLLFDVTKKEIHKDNEIRAGMAILAGGDVNLDIVANPRIPLLIKALKIGYKKLAQLLIEHGADVDITDSLGFTPLMIAIQDDLVDMVSMLLQYGAHPNLKNDDDQTALMLAVYRNNVAIVQELLNRDADPTVKDVDGNTALKIAKRNKNKIIKRLLKEALSTKRCIIT